MSKKQDYILDYIKNLDIGSKVSIRTLAENLLVSEGTAYKAIKKAEELGMVHTRPRAGTVRISDQSEHNNMTLKIHHIVQKLGLSVIVSGETDIPVASIIIGDGSVEQLTKDSARIIGNKLCIVGDRPEIQAEALNLGMHLLVTGETDIHPNILTAASQNNLYVLSSHQSCHNLLHLIHNMDSYAQPSTNMNRAGDWMQKPEYLYYNDILSDWYRTYFPVFALNDKYAVIDDDLKICGLLKAASILNASPEERISDLYNRSIDIQDFTVSENTTMHDLAKKMISKNTEILYTEENGKLKGFITANDVLRYYLFTNSSSNKASSLSPQLISETVSKNKRIYSIDSRSTFNTAEPLNNEQLFSLALEAANEHAKSIFEHIDYKVISGSFYNSNDTLFITDLKITTTIINCSKSACICEIEISNADSNYFKYVLNYSAENN